MEVGVSCAARTLILCVRSGIWLAAGAYGAYYCTCPKLVPGHVHDGKDFTDGTIEDEADALFGIESRFYID